MRIISPAVLRAVIDAGIVSAAYPRHDPARWALPLLDELDARATCWQLVELDADALGALWLPSHAGEACHGDSMSLGDAGGSTVIEAHGWLVAHAAAYAAANPSCWGRITYASGAPASPLVVATVGVGDRAKPAHAPLVVVDGLHRALGYWWAGRRSCTAYLPILKPDPAGIDSVSEA